MRWLFWLLYFTAGNACAQKTFSGEIRYKAITGLKEDSIRITASNQYRRIDYLADEGRSYFLYPDNSGIYFHIDQKNKTFLKLQNKQAIVLKPVTDTTLQDTFILGYRCVPVKFEVMPGSIDRPSGKLYVINWFAADVKWQPKSLYRHDLFPIGDSLVSLKQQIVIYPSNNTDGFTQVYLLAQEIKWYSPPDPLFTIPADYKLADMNSIQVEDIELGQVEEDKEQLPPPPPRKKKKPLK